MKAEPKNTDMKKLTDNEMKAVKLCLNYDDRDGQLCDNYSNGGVEEFKRGLGWNAQQVGGLIASLTEKGIGYMDDDPFLVIGGNGKLHTPDIFWLTEEGVNAYFDQLELKA